MISKEFKKKYTKVIGFINLFLAFICLAVLVYLDMELFGIMGLYCLIVGIWCLEGKEEVK